MGRYLSHWRHIAAAGFLCAALGLAGCFAPAAGGSLTVYFIDVGQGDAILIDQGATEILIDGGPAGSSAAAFIRPYVQGNLEAVVATHPHADHIGGLPEVLRDYRVDAVWDNGEAAATVTYEKYLAAVRDAGLEARTGRAGSIISAAALALPVRNPPDLSANTNNNSLVLSLAWGEVEFLFMGDAEASAEMLLLDSVPHVNVLKLGHHASRTASSQYFLALAHPDVAVYMAAPGNDYGHPHQETLSALSRIGARVFGTDVNGTVRVSSDGRDYEVKTDREGVPQAGASAAAAVFLRTFWLN